MFSLHATATHGGGAGLQGGDQAEEGSAECHKKEKSQLWWPMDSRKKNCSFPKSPCTRQDTRLRSSRLTKSQSRSTASFDEPGYSTSTAQSKRRTPRSMSVFSSPAARKAQAFSPMMPVCERSSARSIVMVG